MRRIVSNNEVSVAYELTYKAVKNINLRVRRDGDVAVSAPRRTSIARIDSFVLTHADKILEAQEKIRRLTVTEASLAPRIQDGAVVFLLGEKVMVQVQQSTKHEVHFDAAAHTLYFRLADIGEGVIEQTYALWLAQFCRKIFSAVLKKTQQRFKACQVPMPTLRIREMKTRWGSCIPAKKTITLNARLIHYPLSSIEYVTVHELCHFLEANHSVRFYGWMDKMLPTWRMEKEKLTAWSGGRMDNEAEKKTMRIYRNRYKNVAVARRKKFPKCNNHIFIILVLNGV